MGLCCFASTVQDDKLVEASAGAWGLKSLLTLERLEIHSRRGNGSGKANWPDQIRSLLLPESCGDVFFPLNHSGKCLKPSSPWLRMPRKKFFLS